MPLPLKKKDRKKVAVAHIVAPAHQLAAAKRGEEVKSLCGDATITGDPVPDAPICQKCVLAQLEADDKTSDARVRQEADRSRANVERLTGEARQARADAQQARERTMREIREAAERRALEVKQETPVS